jgi:hypothetical protein
MNWSSKLRRGRRISANLMQLLREPSKLRTLKIQYHKKNRIFVK